MEILKLPKIFTPGGSGNLTKDEDIVAGVKRFDDAISAAATLIDSVKNIIKIYTVPEELNKYINFLYSSDLKNPCKSESFGVGIPPSSIKNGSDNYSKFLEQVTILIQNGTSIRKELGTLKQKRAELESYDLKTDTFKTNYNLSKAQEITDYYNSYIVSLLQTFSDTKDNLDTYNKKSTDSLNELKNNFDIYQSCLNKNTISESEKKDTTGGTEITETSTTSTETTTTDSTTTTTTTTDSGRDLLYPYNLSLVVSIIPTEYSSSPYATTQNTKVSLIVTNTGTSKSIAKLTIVEDKSKYQNAYVQNGETTEDNIPVVMTDNYYISVPLNVNETTTFLIPYTNNSLSLNAGLSLNIKLDILDENMKYQRTIDNQVVAFFAAYDSSLV